MAFKPDAGPAIAEMVPNGGSTWSKTRRPLFARRCRRGDRRAHDTVPARRSQADL